jgi:general secretion pathway protein I
MTPTSVWNSKPFFRRFRFGPLPEFPSPGEGGFTLLEVMIAISLLAISLTTLFGSQSQSVSLGLVSKFNTQAPLLAQLKLAEFATAADLPSSDSGDFGDDFPGFQWKMETNDVILETSKILSDLEGGLQVLTLTVSWGKDYSYQLQSYLLKNPVP